MEDWFHSILAHLYYNYPFDNSRKNINSYLIDELKIQPSHAGHMIALSSIIGSLNDKGYIEGRPQPPSNEISRGNVIGTTTTGYDTPNDLTTHRIEIRLTLDGYDYITKWERETKLYKGTARINRWFWVTIGIAMIGAGTSIGNFIINKSAAESKLLLKEKDTLLKQKQQIISAQLYQLKLDSLAIDSLKRVSKFKTSLPHQP